MILYRGEIFPSSKQDELIEKLKTDIPEVLKKNDFDPEDLLHACEVISKRAEQGEYDSIAKPLLEFAHVGYDTYLEYARMFSRDGLLEKMKHEWQGMHLGMNEVNEHLNQYMSPLGVLFHISAGNVDFLPAYTVVEGLLAGNINILKLPTGDNGLSVRILKEIIDVSPRLADYIYVFDVPSTEIESMKKLAALANAIVVWGGDMAIQGARSLSSPNQKIIEWGHKLSFGYVLKDYVQEELMPLAYNVCRTNQLLCSSVQGVYFDSDDPEEIKKFASDFFLALKKANTEMGPASVSQRGKSALSVYNEKLERDDITVFQGEGVSVIAYPDSELNLSFLNRNVWVKGLKKERIVDALWGEFGTLQSVALVGHEGREEAMQQLIKAGVTHISSGDISDYQLGESHDGKFPLMEYVRIVDVEK